MKARIEVTDRLEARLIRRGLMDKSTRALVKVIGALLPLDRADQQRTLLQVVDRLNMRRPEE